MSDPRTGIDSWREYPGHSFCLRCRTAWGTVAEHSTRFATNSGMFPLCELCWAELTPQERLPFYRVLWEQWHMAARGKAYTVDAEWPDIEKAVLANL